MLEEEGKGADGYPPTGSEGASFSTPFLSSSNILSKSFCACSFASCRSLSLVGKLKLSALVSYASLDQLEVDRPVLEPWSDCREEDAVWLWVVFRVRPLRTRSQAL